MYLYPPVLHKRDVEIKKRNDFIKPNKPILTIEDMKSGNSSKVLEAIHAGLDLKKLKNLVHHVRGLHLQRTNFEYLKSILLPFVSGYFSSTATSNIDELIYRAVPWGNKPKNKTQLSYPPADKVQLGRANTQQCPVFYGSAGCHSTILELEPNHGDRLAISKWRIKKNLNLFCVGYTKNAFLGKSGMNRFEQLPWIKHHEAHHLSHKHGNQFVHEFLAREFTKRVATGKEWEYKISTAISEMLMNALSFGVNGAPPVEIAGILYPSTPNEANADNVALKCFIADEYLEFVSVQYIEVSSKIDQYQYNMLGIDYADSLLENGDIEWKGSFPSHLFAGTDLTAKFDGQYLEIFDNKNVAVGKLQYVPGEKISINFPTITS